MAAIHRSSVMDELDSNAKLAPVGRLRTARDLAIIVGLIACVIASSAHAPSNTYIHAQLQQIGAVIGTIESGEWLLPRDQGGGLARKPQLYAWIDAPLLMLTGIYNDLTFRFPTVIASFETGILVYFLGRRWYGRRVGLLAACLWAIPHHMGKAMYVAVTDMMLSMWILVSIMCADKLLFHPAPKGERRFWIIALWIAMILGAMSKGWGVLNLILIGTTLALWTALAERFDTMRASGGIVRKVLAVLRTILHRWWEAMKATGFGWGLAAMLAVLVPIWIAMFIKGGEEFRQIVSYEFFSRVTGAGPAAPHSSSVPAIGHLLYYTLPTSIFAIGAMCLVKPRQWFTKASPIFLPLCWIVAVVLPFSLTHGFRHDYLLPCYPAVALMGAWGIEELSRRICANSGGKSISLLRHLFAASAVIVSSLLAIITGAFLFHEYLPGAASRKLPIPPIMAAETWWILAMLLPIAVCGLVVGVWASLRRRIYLVVAVTIVGMVGVIFVYRHTLSRPARTGDGERMVQFARKVRPIIGSDDFAVARARKLATELYLGRFGLDILNLRRTDRMFTTQDEPDFPEGDAGKARRKAWRALETLKRSGLSWLITCDRALVEMGLAEISTTGPVKLKRGGKKLRFRTLPDSVGSTELMSEPIISQRWGRAYLIRLDSEKLARLDPKKISAGVKPTGFQSGRQD